MYCINERYTQEVIINSLIKYGNRRFLVYQHVTSFSHMRGALVGRRTTAAGFHMQNMCDV